MLTQAEATAAAKVVSIVGIGGACRVVREMRGLPIGCDISSELSEAVGGMIWLLPEVEAEKRLREFAAK